MNDRFNIKASVLSVWFTAIVMSLLWLTGVIFIIVAAFNMVPSETPEEHFPLLLFFIAWTLAVSLACYSQLKKAVEIIVMDGKKICIRSRLSRRMIEVSQITRLGCNSDGEWTLYHNNGRIDLNYFNEKTLLPFIMWVIEHNSEATVPDNYRNRRTTI